MPQLQANLWVWKRLNDPQTPWNSLSTFSPSSAIRESGFRYFQRISAWGVERTEPGHKFGMLKKKIDNKSPDLIWYCGYNKKSIKQSNTADQPTLLMVAVVVVVVVVIVIVIAVGWDICFMERRMNGSFAPPNLYFRKHQRGLECSQSIMSHPNPSQS